MKCEADMMCEFFLDELRYIDHVLRNVCECVERFD